MPAGELLVVADLNETLVRERTLGAWTRDWIAAAPPLDLPFRLLRAGTLGALALAADLAGLDRISPRVGFLVLAGVREADLAAWARSRLSPNPRAHAVLTRLAREAGPLRLRVVSRGTPGLAVRAYLARDDVRAFLEALPLAAPPEIVAPELEQAGAVLTGRVAGVVHGKRARASLVPDGAVFLGDRRDRSWVLRAHGRRIRFEEV